MPARPLSPKSPDQRKLPSPLLQERCGRSKAAGTRDGLEAWGNFLTPIVAHSPGCDSCDSRTAEQFEVGRELLQVIWSNHALELKSSHSECGGLAPAGV